MAAHDHTYALPYPTDNQNEPVNFSQSWLDNFNPEDSFERFYPKEQEITPENSLDLDHDMNSNDLDDHGSIDTSVTIIIRPYEAFLNLMKEDNGPPQTSVCGHTNLEVAADFLQPETPKQKICRIGNWIQEIPSEFDSDSDTEAAVQSEWPASASRKTPQRFEAEDRAFRTAKKRLSSEETACNGDIEKIGFDKNPVLVSSFIVDKDQAARQTAGVKRKWDGELDLEGQCGNYNEGYHHMDVDYLDRVKVCLNKEGNSRTVFTKSQGGFGETRKIQKNSSGYGQSEFEKSRQERLVRFGGELDRLKASNPIKGNVTIAEEDNSVVNSEIARDMYRKVADYPHTSLASPPEMSGSEVRRERERRPIIIDGCNVAYEASQGKFFETIQIQVCVDYFLNKGFTDITVVVPELRLTNRGCSNPQVLRQLKDRRLLITSWSRQLPNGKYVSPYDDRMIIEIADKRGGVIVSNDRFRDIAKERPEWANTIEFRVLPFRFMPGKPNEIMFPSDPFGRYGPSLEQLLRF